MRLYKIIRPLIFCLPAEMAHRLTVRVLSTIGKFIPTPGRDDYILSVSAMGLKFSNPFGCLLYTSPSPRDTRESRMPSSA